MKKVECITWRKENMGSVVKEKRRGEKVEGGGGWGWLLLVWNYRILELSYTPHFHAYLRVFSTQLCEKELHAHVPADSLIAGNAQKNK